MTSLGPPVEPLGAAGSVGQEMPDPVHLPGLARGGYLPLSPAREAGRLNRVTTGIQCMSASGTT